MSLFDFFFPEQAQATYLRELAGKGSLSSQIKARPWLDPALRASREEQMRTERKGDDVGTLALICESLIRIGERKGIFTREELFEVMNEVDMEDGKKDGKFRTSLIAKPIPADDTVA